MAEGRTNTVASQLPLLEGEFLVGDQHPMSYKNTQRKKRKSQIPELLKGYPVSSSSDKGGVRRLTLLQYLASRGCLRRAHCRDGKAAISSWALARFLHLDLHHFSCYCSDKQGLLMHQWNATPSGNASVNTINETASLETSLLPDLSGWEVLLP